MTRPKSLTGVIQLPNARLNFHLSFDGKETEPCCVGQEAKMMGRILEKTLELSPELQDIIIDFAEHLKKTTGDSSRQRPD